MGYFGALEKRARTSGGWGAWGALSGADYVSSEGKCVVYRVRAHYDSADAALSALGVATNFVSPLTSANPSTACCYLYTFDPTGGEVSAPPGGYAAMAGPVAFEASNVGNYISFHFPAPSGAPEWLYFFFTSTARYADYGTNQIYHYATGNWSDAYQTGTRTPAVTGGLSGTTGGGSSGGEGGFAGVDSYKIKDCGARYNIPQTQQSFSMSMARGEIGRMTLSFDYAVQTDIVVSSSGRSEMTYLFFSDCAEIDTHTGRPLSTLREFDADGALTATRVEKGRVYYVFAMYYGGAESGQVSFTLSPPAAKWSVGDTAEYTALKNPVTRPIALAKAKYSVLKMSFAYSGVARFYTDATTVEAEMVAMGYFGRNDSVDTSDGTATDYLAHSHGDMATGDPPDYDMTYYVEAGQTYYLITSCFSASFPMSTSIHIIPPEEEGAAWLSAGGTAREAECYVYTGGAWRAASPRVYARGAWHTGI